MATEEAEFQAAVLNTVKPYSLLSDERLLGIYKIATALETNRVKGCFAEFGVCNGGSAGILAAVAHRFRSGRCIWLFDSFEGMPTPGELDVAHNGEPGQKGMTRGDEATVRELLFDRLKLDPSHIRIVKGWFETSVPPHHAAIGPIAMLHVDCDWYDSVRFCFEQFYDQVVPGGFIVIDDYGHWRGARKAVDEFIAQRGLNVEIHQIDYTGVFFQKPVNQSSHAAQAFSLDDDLDRGRDLLRGGRFQEAIFAFEKLLEQNGSSREVWNDLGCAQALAGQIEVAEASLKKAMSLEVSNGVAKGNLAALYASQQRYLEAIALLEQLLLEQPDVETLLDLADCYRQMGVYDSARLGYQRVLEASPDHPRAVAGLSGISS